MVANGLPLRNIYREGRRPEDLAALARATRDDQIVGLSHGLRILGGSHSEIADAVKKIHRKRGILVDAQTKERSDRDGVAMLSRALGMIRGGLTMGDQAAEIGRLGGLARGRAAAENRLPIEKARKIWLNKRIRNNALAISRMRGWNLATAHEHFGPSGRKAGRPSQKK